MSTKDHEFSMHLTPNGRESTILLDGEDISGLLTGISVSSGVHVPTTIQLFPGKGKRATLIARLPESRITLELESSDPHQAGGPESTAAPGHDLIEGCCPHCGASNVRSQGQGGDQK